MINLDEIQSALDYIAAIDENDEQAYEKILKTFINIRFIPAFTNTFYKNEDSGRLRATFRTRTHTDTKFFQKLNDISYPPSWTIKSYARCNRPNQSVFYCAENRPTSYMELVEYWAKEKNIGDKIAVTIGMWEFQRDLNLYIIPKPQDRITDSEKFYGEMYDKKMAEGGYDKNMKDLSDLIFSFIYEQFSRPAKNDKKTYFITSAFTNLIMMNPNIDGILYPSVPYGGNGFNSAIKRSVVETGGIKLVHVTKDTFKIRETEEGKHHFLQIDSFSTNNINNESGEIKWNHFRHFIKRILQFSNPFT
jgi:hypothetical protein